MKDKSLPQYLGKKGESGQKFDFGKYSGNEQKSDEKMWQQYLTASNCEHCTIADYSPLFPETVDLSAKVYFWVPVKNIKEMYIFELEFTPCKPEEPLQGMEL